MDDVTLRYIKGTFTKYIRYFNQVSFFMNKSIFFSLEKLKSHFVKKLLNFTQLSNKLSTLFRKRRKNSAIKLIANLCKEMFSLSNFAFFSFSYQKNFLYSLLESLATNEKTRIMKNGIYNVQ